MISSTSNAVMELSISKDGKKSIFGFWTDTFEGSLHPPPLKLTDREDPNLVSFYLSRLNWEWQLAIFCLQCAFIVQRVSSVAKRKVFPLEFGLWFGKFFFSEIYFKLSLKTFSGNVFLGKFSVSAFLVKGMCCLFWITKLESKQNMNFVCFYKCFQITMWFGKFFWDISSCCLKPSLEMFVSSPPPPLAIPETVWAYRFYIIFTTMSEELIFKR